jgi:hypothetical protein
MTGKAYHVTERHFPFDVFLDEGQQRISNLCMPYLYPNRIVNISRKKFMGLFKVFKKQVCFP